MAQGVPVICSDRASMPEVGGEAVLTFDPYSAESLAQQLVKIIQDASFRNQMIENGLARAQIFTAKKQAQRVLSIFNESSLDLKT